MELTKLNYRDLLVVLIWEKKVLCDLFEKDQKYSSLLQELKKHDIDGYDPLPYQKDLLKILDMSRTQLMGLMHELYEDFRKKLKKPDGYPISDTQIFLVVETRDENFWRLGVREMKLIPKKGESFIIPFIRGEWSHGYFQVKEVSHELEKGIHTIDIYLSDKFE